MYVWGEAVDNTGAIVPAWMPKSNNFGKTSLFPRSWDKEKIMQEIAYARWKLTPSNWEAPTLPATSSNEWIGRSSDNSTKIGMYLGSNLTSSPTTTPLIIENYGSAFPIK